MIKSKSFEIGDTKIILYQRVIIITGTILTFLFSILTISYKNPNFLYFPFIVLIFFGLLTALYLKIFSIKYDKETFIIENILKKIEIPSDEFINVIRVRNFEFLLRVTFKGESFLVLMKSDEYFRYLFKSNTNFSLEITNKVFENLGRN
jgi:hypothetical protein